MSMNLDWLHCQTGNYKAMLPDIPGYPISISGPLRSLSHCVWLIRPNWDTRDVTDKWTFTIGLHLKDGRLVELTNEDLHIPGTATADELKKAVENLTVEDIAAAFKKKGYQPVAE